ncbi:AP2 domain-containing protein [Variovorax sp. OK212]|nr:AP2 domain-containing protein [Variovorax sp. OK202]SFC63000.1 AP2 domain-containing protein [Variovorax sp. OK212]
MPLGVPNPLAMYGIRRAKDRWEVCIMRDGQRHRKVFTFSKHGEELGLVAAQAWRDHIVATYPAMSLRQKVQRVRPDTKEELPGIFCRRDADGRPVLWTAHTKCGPSKMMQKSFSIGRYGDLAKDMAVRERERQLTQMRGVVFGLLDAKGRQLLEQHVVEPEPAVIESIPWPVPSTGLLNQGNTSGFAGVHLQRGRNGKPRAWAARTRGGHITQSKLFPIAKYGDAKAKELAIAERQRQLERLVQLNTELEATDASSSR